LIEGHVPAALSGVAVSGNGAVDDLIPLNGSPVLSSSAMASILTRFSSAIALLLCAACALSGCGPAARSNNEPAPQNAAEPAAANLPVEVPLPQPPMDRAALLAAVARARSSAAAGSPDAEAQRALDGKQFQLRIRFGCSGPAPGVGGAPLGWTYDADKHVLRVSATPTITGDDPLVAQLKPKDVEAVEGFWLERPWLLHAECPAKPETGEDESAADRSAGEVAKTGLAQFFTAADPRTTRRNRRPYQATKTLDPDARLGRDGFDLVLEGRLRAAGGRVILCRAVAADRPPDCIVSARVDRVRFEQPETGETIAEWGSS
jgi:hypothetical protein